MLIFKFLHPQATPDMLGLIPAFFVDTDPRPAVDQINERYAHGGGWFDLKVGEKGFTHDEQGSLLFPEDPPLPALAEAWLHKTHVPGSNPPPERIVIHVHGFVAIHQPDGSFRVGRLD